MLLVGGTCLASHAKDMSYFKDWIFVYTPDDHETNSFFAATYTTVDPQNRTETYIQTIRKDHKKFICKTYLNHDCTKYYLAEIALFDQNNILVSNNIDLAAGWQDIVPGSSEEKVYREAYQYAHKKSAR